MSSRLLLIDFYYQYLFKEEVDSATICFLDQDSKNFENQELMNLFVNQENIKVFHLKMPRVFEKEYSVNNLTNTIIDFVLENPSVNSLKYEDLSADILDPYYLKSIQSIKFKYLHFVKLFKEDIISIILLAYSNKEHLNLKPAALKSLEQKLVNLEEEEIVNFLNKKIVEYSNNYYLENDSKSQMYFSQNLQEILKVKKYYERTIQKGIFDEVQGRIKRLIRSSETKVVEFNKIKMYFFQDIREKGKNIYSLCDLEINPKNDFITIIYIANQAFVDLNFFELLKKLDEIFNEQLIEDYDYYQISDNELYVIIDNLVEQRILEKTKEQIEKIDLNDNELRVFYLNTAYNLSLNNLNYNTLARYLKHLTMTGNSKFNKDEYKEYLRRIASSKYLSEKVIGQESKIKKVIDSNTNQVIGDYLGYYHLDLDKFQKPSFYHHASTYVFKQAQSLVGERLFFRINYGEFSSKKVWFNLRKITNFREKYIILSEIEISNQTEFNKFISDLDRLHALDFKIFIDSSIFSSIMMNDVISHFEGIYVEDYEMTIGDLEGESLFKTVISFYLRENKIILLHQFHNFYQFNDPNVYYINEIEA